MTAHRIVVLFKERELFKPTVEVTLPAGWPLPRIGERVIPPGQGDGGEPYEVEVVEHYPEAHQTLVVARGSA